jgi:hypothetical protein
VAITTKESANGKSPSPSVAKATGRSGTVNTRGFIQDREFNRNLLWPLNLDEYDKMRRTDPTVRWMLALVSTPIRAALWQVEPPENPTPEEMEATCFARHAIFEEMDGGWDEHLRQLLTYLDFGHSVFEREAELRTVEFDIDPLEFGQDPTHIKRDAFVLASLGPRLQRTIQRWIVDPNEPKRLVKVIQWLADGHVPAVAEIEADRCLVYVNEKEGDDWRGVSILRSAWKSYFTKMELQNIEAIAFERTAGLPVVYPPEDAGPDQLDAVEDAVKSLRQGESVYIVMPGPKQFPTRGTTGGTKEWLIENLDVNADGGLAAEFGSAISRYDTEMAKNVMASFMQLGMQEVGARATADVQQDPYYQAIEAHVGYIEDTFTEGVLRPLVDWNYTVDRYPRLVASKIQAKNAQVIAAAVKGLVEVGAIQADEPLEDYLRDLLDAPDRDPDYEEDEGEITEEREGPRATEPRGQTDPSKSQGGGTQGPGEPGTGAAPGMAASNRKRYARRAGRSQSTRRNDAGRVAFAQFIPPRPLQGVEQHVAWQQVKDTLDNAQLDLIAIGERVMEGQLESLEASADEAVERADIKAIEALAPDPQPLAEVLEAELQRIYQTGQADVRAEVRRQESEPMAEEREAGEPPKIPVSKSEIAAIIAALAASMAETGISAATQALKQKALKALAQRAKTDAQPGGLEDPLAELRAALRKSAPLASNRIYSMGRMDEIKSLHYRGMVSVVQRSAILDGNTCDPCEEADGGVYSPETAPPLPDPDCEGGDKCRCIYVPDIAPPGEIEGA